VGLQQTSEDESKANSQNVAWRAMS